MRMRQRVTLTEDAQRPSAKIERLRELFDDHRPAGRKIIVFSYFLKVLERLGEEFDNCGVISGSVSLKDREDILQRFKTDQGSQLLLAQITAAGQGLNLQEATVVVLMEPQLTPGSEAQAIARRL